MEHSHAVDSNAVERYLLLEMSTAERDEFEDHYFSCTACADGVRAGAQFRDAARLHLAALREDSEQMASQPVSVRVASRRKWWAIPQLVPMGLAAALACTVVYQNAVQIPELARRTAAPVAPQAMVSVPLHGVTRGAAERIPKGGDFFTVYFDLPATEGGGALDCQITAAGGKQAAKISLKPQADGTGSLLLPRVDFPSGDYTITLRNGTIVVSQLNFTVE